MADEATLEQDLRAMFARRDPGMLPAALPDVVVGRLRDEGDRRLGLGWWRAFAGAGAVAAALAVIAVLLLGRTLAPGSTSNGGVAPAPSVPPSLVAGNGLSEDALFPLIQAGLALAVVAGLAWVAYRTQRRILGYAAVATILGIAWVGSMIGTSDALSGEDGAGGVSPTLGRPAGFDNGTFVRANGDSEFRIVRTVTNTSRLPLDLLGLQPFDPLPSGGNRVSGPRLIGLGYLPPDDCCLPENARPFARLTLQPGQSIDLVVLGRAGTCATSEPGNGGAIVFDFVPLVYDQLTILHVQDVPLPDPVEIFDGPC